MKRIMTLMIGIGIIAAFTTGCNGPDAATAQYNQNTQFLEAQQTTITSVENEITHIRQGCGADMSRWSPDTLALYSKLQEQLRLRHEERDRLIKRLSGDTIGVNQSQPTQR